MWALAQPQRFDGHSRRRVRLIRDRHGNYCQAFYLSCPENFLTMTQFNPATTTLLGPDRTEFKNSG